MKTFNFLKISIDFTKRIFYTSPPNKIFLDPHSTCFPKTDGFTKHQSMSMGDTNHTTPFHSFVISFKG